MFEPRPEPMTPEQRAHTDALSHVWPAFGEFVVERHELAGGMQWKSVSGADYLMRYRPHPEGGSRKVARSLGKRTPETEALFDEYLRRRESVTRKLEELAPRIEMLGRVSKPFGTARLDAGQAQHLRRLHEAGFLSGTHPVLLPFGAPAMAGYEGIGRFFSPDRYLRTEAGGQIIFYIREVPGPKLIREITASLFTAKIPTRIDEPMPGHWVIVSKGHDGSEEREIELVSRHRFEEELAATNFEGETCEEIVDALSLDAVPVVVSAADGTVAGYAAPDPRALALCARPIARATGGDAEADLRALKLATFVIQAIDDGVLDFRFTPAQRDALIGSGFGWIDEIGALAESEGPKAMRA